MKTTTILSLTILILNFTTYATNPALEVEEKNETQKIEFNEILEKALDVDDNLFVTQIKEKCKIIIIDENFNTIREESVSGIENVNNQSILVPTIYRSQFITTVHNVSYYMLEKK